MAQRDVAIAECTNDFRPNERQSEAILYGIEDWEHLSPAELCAKIVDTRHRIRERRQRRGRVRRRAADGPVSKSTIRPSAKNVPRRRGRERKNPNPRPGIPQNITQQPAAPLSQAQIRQQPTAPLQQPTAPFQQPTAPLSQGPIQQQPAAPLQPAVGRIPQTAQITTQSGVPTHTYIPSHFTEDSWTQYTHDIYDLTPLLDDTAQYIPLEAIPKMAKDGDLPSCMDKDKARHCNFGLGTEHNGQSVPWRILKCVRSSSEAQYNADYWIQNLLVLRMLDPTFDIGTEKLDAQGSVFWNANYCTRVHPYIIAALRITFLAARNDIWDVGSLHRVVIPWLFRHFQSKSQIRPFLYTQWKWPNISYGTYPLPEVSITLVYESRVSYSRTWKFKNNKWSPDMIELLRLGVPGIATTSRRRFGTGVERKGRVVEDGKNIIVEIPSEPSEAAVRMFLALLERNVPMSVSAGGLDQLKETIEIMISDKTPITFSSTDNGLQATYREEDDKVIFSSNSRYVHINTMSKTVKIMRVNLTNLIANDIADVTVTKSSITANKAFADYLRDTLEFYNFTVIKT